MTPDENFDPEFQADPGLEETLKREAAGILADMVEQARAFFASGSILNPPEEVIAATVDYFKSEDTIGQYFDATRDPTQVARPARSIFAKISRSGRYVKDGLRSVCRPIHALAEKRRGGIGLTTKPVELSIW